MTNLLLSNLDVYLPLGIGLAIIICLIVFLICYYPKLKQQEALRRQKIEEEYEKEPEYVFIKAKVLKKRKDFYYVSNINIPRSQEDYFVTFLTQSGEEKEYPVGKEAYDEILENQEGELVTVNGNFFYFGDGEEVAEEENN